jgi:hypothetical protein
MRRLPCVYRLLYAVEVSRCPGLAARAHSAATKRPTFRPTRVVARLASHLILLQNFRVRRSPSAPTGLLNLRRRRLCSGEEAVLTIGVSHHERMAGIRRIRRSPALSFGPPEWLPAEALDDTHFRLLRSGKVQ